LVHIRHLIRFVRHYCRRSLAELAFRGSAANTMAQRTSEVDGEQQGGFRVMHK